jgi:hypothetical protein
MSQTVLKIEIKELAEISKDIYRAKSLINELQEIFDKINKSKLSIDVKHQ